jgi:hypothetical protein
MLNERSGVFVGTGVSGTGVFAWITSVVYVWVSEEGFPSSFVEGTHEVKTKMQRKAMLTWDFINRLSYT